MWFWARVSQPGLLKEDWMIFCTEGKWKSPLLPWGTWKNMLAGMLPDSRWVWLDLEALRISPSFARNVRNIVFKAQTSSVSAPSGNCIAVIARNKVDWSLLRLCQKPRLPATRTGDFRGKADGRMPRRGTVRLHEQGKDQAGLLWGKFLLLCIVWIVSLDCLCPPYPESPEVPSQQGGFSVWAHWWGICGHILTNPFNPATRHEYKHQWHKLAPSCR